MRTQIILVILSLLHCNISFADYKHFSKKDLHVGLLGAYRNVQIIPGRIPSTMSVANNGKQIVFTDFDIKMKSHLYLYNIETKKTKKIKANNAFIHSPILLGGMKGYAKKILVRIGSSSKKVKNNVPIGIYSGNLNTLTPKWKIWKAGNYDDLAINYKESFITMTLTINERDAIRELWVQKIKNSKPMGKAYRVAKNISGVISNPIFSRDSKRIYFDLWGSPTKNYSKGLYVTENKANSQGELVNSGISDATIVWNYLTYDFNNKDILYVTKRPSDGNLYEYNVQTKKLKKYIRGNRNIKCRTPKMNPSNGIIYFVASKHTDYAGVIRNGITYKENREEEKPIQVSNNQPKHTPSPVITTPEKALNNDVVSVFYYKNTRGKKSFDWLSKGITDMLITELSKSYQIQVVERENLQKILKEQELSLTGLMDQNKKVEIGQLLNANQLIYGSFIILNNKIRIDTKLVSVKTGKILKTWSVEGLINNIFNLEKRLAKKVFSFFNVKEPDTLDYNETKSINAIQTYYEGITLLDDGKVEKALNKFLRSQEYDPLYSRPHSEIEKAYKFLKNFKKIRKHREIKKLYNKLNLFKMRLNTKKWKTYADILKEHNMAKMSSDEIKKFNKKHYAYILCQTPIQCSWHIMLTLQEIADKTEEYYNDVKIKNKLYKESLKVAKKAKQKYENDPFISEICYMEIYIFYILKDYKKVKDYAEKFMTKYPDYRMITAVEDRYEDALKKLK